jgi:hypothetical protein
MERNEVTIQQKLFQIARLALEEILEEHIHRQVHFMTNSERFEDEHVFVQLFILFALISCSDDL